MARKLADRMSRATGNTPDGESIEGENGFSRRRYLKSGVAAATASLATMGTAAAQTGIEFRSFQFDQVIDAVDDLGLDPTANSPINGDVYSVPNGTLVVFPDGDYLVGGHEGLYGSGGDVGWVAKAAWDAYQAGDTRDPLHEPGVDYDDIYQADVTFHIDNGVNIFFPNFGNGSTVNFIMEGIEYDYDSQAPSPQSGYRIAGGRSHLDGVTHVRNVSTTGRALNWDNPGSESFRGFWRLSVQNPHDTSILHRCDVLQFHDWALYTTLDGSGASGNVGVWTGVNHAGHIHIEECQFSEIGNNALYMSTTDLASGGSVVVEDCHFENVGAAMARLPSNGESGIYNSTFVFDQAVYTGPDFHDQQSNNVSSRAVVVETTGQNGFHDQSTPFEIVNCHFEIHETAYHSPAIHWYPGGTYSRVENCTFNHTVLSSRAPHVSTPGGVLQASESRPHWGGQPSRHAHGVDGSIEIVNCHAYVDAPTAENAAEAVVQIADRPNSFVHGCCFEVVSPNNIDGVVAEAYNWNCDVDVQDTTINVTGTPTRTEGGATLTSGAIDTTGSCTVDPIEPIEPDPDPELSATTTFDQAVAAGPPADWTPQWASAGVEWSVADGILAFDAEEGARHALSWDEIPPVADVELLAKIRVPTIAAAGNHGRLHLRSSGGAGSENGYYFDIREEGFALFKYLNGHGELLDQTGTPAGDTWYWVRFRAVGTDIQLRFWADGETEPDAWQIAASDGSLTDGWVGVGSYDAEPSEWTVFSVGTGGLAAPMPEDDGDDPDLSVYADDDGTVSADGVDAAIQDWRVGELATDDLIVVVDAWRSGTTIG